LNRGKILPAKLSKGHAGLTMEMGSCIAHRDDQLLSEVLSILDASPLNSADPLPGLLINPEKLKKLRILKNR